MRRSWGDGQRRMTGQRRRWEIRAKPDTGPRRDGSGPGGAPAPPAQPNVSYRFPGSRSSGHGAAVMSLLRYRIPAPVRRTCISRNRSTSSGGWPTASRTWLSRAAAGRRRVSGSCRHSVRSTVQRHPGPCSRLVDLVVLHAARSLSTISPRWRQSRPSRAGSTTSPPRSFSQASASNSAAPMRWASISHAVRWSARPVPGRRVPWCGWRVAGIATGIGVHAGEYCLPSVRACALSDLLPARRGAPLLLRQPPAVTLLVHPGADSQLGRPARLAEVGGCLVKGACGGAVSPGVVQSHHLQRLQMGRKGPWGVTGDLRQLGDAYSVLQSLQSPARMVTELVPDAGLLMDDQCAQNRQDIERPPQPPRGGGVAPGGGAPGGHPAGVRLGADGQEPAEHSPAAVPGPLRRPGGPPRNCAAGMWR